jgi:hypothetical protein
VIIKKRISGTKVYKKTKTRNFNMFFWLSALSHAAQKLLTTAFLSLISAARLEFFG